MVHYVAAALGGRRIVLSTSASADELNGNRAPKEARLFIYDVGERKFSREIVPVPAARATGLIAEAAPGRVLGLTAEGAEWGKPGAGVLYGIDVDTGDVLFRKVLPWPVGADPYWPHWVDPSYENLDLARGPDGFLWTYLKDVLVRVDPADATFHVVGRLERPGRPTLVGDDLYLSGTEALRRIRAVARTR